MIGRRSSLRTNQEAQCQIRPSHTVDRLAHFLSLFFSLISDGIVT